MPTTDDVLVLTVGNDPDLECPNDLDGAWKPSDQDNFKIQGKRADKEELDFLLWDLPREGIHACG